MFLKFRRFGVFLLLAVGAYVPAHAYAQSIGGTILGLVKDLSGPVPQAEVRITNIATGQLRFWLTDDQGRYELREVPPGLYELAVSKPGYATFSTPPSESLHLGLAQVANVTDINLRVSPVGETKIEVKAADVAMTDSNTATLGTAFDERQIRSLPLSAKDVNNLGLLAPGVVNAGTFNVASTSVAFAVSGSRGRDNNFIIDSVDNNEPLFGGAATQFTNNEVFEEFHILTGQFQAEYGRNSGSIVNITTKQGGRDFHASVFWFGQNDAVNAMTKVEKQSGLKKPARFYENQLGATLSGPIRPDSSWFFLSYQWDRARNDLSSQYPVVVTLPTVRGLAMLKANDALNPSLTLNALIADPLVEALPTLNAPCGPLPGDTGPISPKNPCTTGSGATLNGVPVPFGTYLVPEANVTDLRDHEVFSRIDEKAGGRDNFFFRYFFDDFLTALAPSSSPAENGYNDFGLLPEWRNFLAERTQNFGSAWTHASNRALNEFRISYSRISSQIGPLHPNSQEGDTPSILGVDNFAPFPTNAAIAAGNTFTLGRDSRPTRFINNIYQVQENYSFADGAHDIKLGANLNLTRSGLNEIPGDLGQYVYSPFESFATNSSGAAYLRFGNLGGHGGGILPLQEIAQFYFAEDSVRISPKFVLNLGLRYENYSPFFNSVLDRSESTPLSPPRIERVFTDFAPRLGFAWGLAQHMVFRGGYGISYNPTFLDIALLAWQRSPISPLINGQVPTNKYPSPPYVGSDVANPSFANCLGPSPLYCTTANTVSKHLRNPFVHDASLGMQMQVRSDFLLEASYVGSRGTRLFQQIDGNPPAGPTIEKCQRFTGAPNENACFGVIAQPTYPDRGSITEVTNGGFSTYSGLVLSANKRFGRVPGWRNLEWSSVYTWSHMIDNTSDIFGSGLLQRLTEFANSTSIDAILPAERELDETPFAQNPANTRAGEKGNSSFDSRHRLALSIVWDLPAPSNATRIFLGNWEVAGIFTAQSGQPFSPLDSSSVPCSGYGYGFSFNSFAPSAGFLGSARPNIGNPRAPADTVALLNNVGCVDPKSAVPGVAEFAKLNPLVPGAGPYITPSGQTIDSSAARFVQVPYGEFGNAGRNVLTGPAIVDLDLSLSKSISFTEKFKAQLRVETFNLFNRRNPSAFAGNPFIAADQQVSSIIFRPIGTLPAFYRVSSPSPSQASINGLTPENAIDAAEPALLYDSGNRPSFLSRQYLTTSCRRIQFSVRFSF